MLIRRTNTLNRRWSYIDTTKTYIRLCKSKSVEPSTETLPDGTKAHWIGRSRDASIVSLYFHGGGFNTTGRPEYLDFLSSAIQSLNQSSDSPRLAALFLPYDTLRFRPGNIFLGGDSAGANLTLALLGHILHPHPDATISRIELSEGEALKGALLISPWVDFSHSAPSFKRNRGKDCISVGTLDRWAGNYLSGAPADPWNQPLTAPRGWWSGLGACVRNVLVVGGSDEIMIDDIVRLGEVLGREWRGRRGDLEVVVAEGEAHDVVLIDRAIGYRPEELRMDREVRRWLKENS
ncbi:hypothetical protein W97_03802 [Coniosporium apollinis CBS 100218]|uniref:Alpha/beta hydrolase fold-3 domain-containing protein n=1 Tax=Coniosporium apollinis (strain CBS 100218) TaxID=1168221 RepID=R7YRX5_CONA1|nr:uncharacterized protein W97_03802 [Coniosporium apollinis CBS 100218]EON64569.1 hypothetical protein W97_03802 [Coniosporium apollinis CBS 100218]